MAMPPMIGRYVGAGRPDRVELLVWLAVRFVILLQLGIAAAWLLLSGLLSSLLASDPEVQGHLADFLLRLPVSWSGLGVCMLMVSACNAMGLPMRALVISVLRLFAWFLPLLWIGGQIGGLNGLFTGAMLGNIAAGITSWLLYKRGIAHLKQQAARSGPEPSAS
jgi:Na+-driven multidrug efflux pump